MKKMYAAWILIVGGLVLSLIVIGLNIGAENRDYVALENDLKESASVYIKTNEIDLNVGEAIKLDDNILKKANLVTELKVNNDECSGYVKVKRNTTNYEYNAYIKCGKYTTEGYVE